MEIKKSLKEVLDGCPAARTIFLTDRDGVPIVHVGEEYRHRPSLIGCQTGAVEQINRLAMGPHKYSIFFYEQTQVVIHNLGTVFAFFIGPADAVTGLMLSARERLLPIVEEIEIALPQVLNEPQGSTQ